MFAASTNSDAPFTDETGNRRFWSVRCSAIDIESLKRDRDQLWAEAYKHYQDGRVWWLDTDELNDLARQEQDERYDTLVYATTPSAHWANDPKQRYETDGGTQLPIEPFYSMSNKVTVADVLVHGIGKPLERCQQADRNQVARCLVHDGWKRKQDRAGKYRDTWFYVRDAQ